MEFVLVPQDELAGLERHLMWIGARNATTLDGRVGDAIRETEHVAQVSRGVYMLLPDGYDAEKIACPVRMVWGTEDKLLPWPRAAVRYREDWLPHADWVVLDGVGHSPQLDVPLETAQLILGFTS